MGRYLGAYCYITGDLSSITIQKQIMEELLNKVRLIDDMSQELNDTAQ